MTKVHETRGNVMFDAEVLGVEQDADFGRVLLVDAPGEVVRRARLVGVPADLPFVSVYVRRSAEQTAQPHGEGFVEPAEGSRITVNGKIATYVTAKGGIRRALVVDECAILSPGLADL